MRNKGRVCTRTSIIEHVWDIHFDADTSVIDVLHQLHQEEAGSEFKGTDSYFAGSRLHSKGR